MPAKRCYNKRAELLQNMIREISDAMPSLPYFLLTFLDTLMGHVVYVLYLLAVTDEHTVRQRLKKLPPLLLSPLSATLLSFGLSAVPALDPLRYFITSFAILAMCTLWIRWAWRFSFWQALAAACMTGIFQVADSTLTFTLSWVSLLDGELLQYAAGLGLHLGISIAAVLLLRRLRFGRWFRLLLDNEADVWRTALFLFALEAAMELFLRLASGVQPEFLVLYYLLVAVTVSLMAGLVVYLARQFDASRKLQAQQDAIAQQQLYEQDLEAIRREVRTFRHDYKNLLAGLAQQAGRASWSSCARRWPGWMRTLTSGWERRYRRLPRSATCRSRRCAASCFPSWPPCGKGEWSAAWRSSIPSAPPAWTPGTLSAVWAS